MTPPRLARDKPLSEPDSYVIPPICHGPLVTDSSGTFSGFTEISVLPEAFERFYAPLAARTSASYTLIREDGAVLARYPVPTTTGIKLDASSGFKQLISRSPEGGTYTAVSGIDQLERRISARKLEGFPVYVTSSLETGEIVQRWLWHMAGHLVFGIPASARQTFKRARSMWLR